MKQILASTTVRWIAVAILLIAYVLVSQGLVPGQGIVFNGMNCLGSVLMIINSLSMKQKDWAVAVFNMVWVLIAVVTIAGTLF